MCWNSAVRNSRPVVQMTAFGSPVEPEVNSSSSVVSGSPAAGASGRGRWRSESSSRAYSALSM